MSDKPNTKFLDGCSTLVSTAFGAVVAGLINQLPPLFDSGVESVLITGMVVMIVFFAFAYSIFDASDILPALFYTWSGAFLGAGLGVYIGGMEQVDSVLLLQLMGVFTVITLLLEIAKKFVESVAKIPILNWLV